MKVALFDYGAGNLHSLAKALEAGGASVLVTRDWTEALNQDALVLPGVGSFGAAVRSLGTARSVSGKGWPTDTRASASASVCKCSSTLPKKGRAMASA